MLKFITQTSPPSCSKNIYMFHIKKIKHDLDKPQTLHPPHPYFKQYIGLLI
jgi:hypothetical protein